MSARKGVTILLLLFVGVSLAYFIGGEAMQRREASREETNTGAGETRLPSTESEGALDASGTVVVYYFHGNRRCNTCRTIESYTEEAVQSGFPEELGSGQVEWRAVNVDRPENRHFVNDFQLSTRTVVFVDTRNGNQEKWIKLEKVWDLVHNRVEFFDYIQGNLVDFLEEPHG